MDIVCTPFDSPLLTPRQLEILQLARRGKSFSEITDLLGISASTLRWYVSQIRRVLPNFETVEKRDPDGLTTREREVALLVAEGLSNRDISARLTVSLNTVSSHIAQLYRKTGAANRVQLANAARIHAFPPSVSLSHAEG